MLPQQKNLMKLFIMLFSVIFIQQYQKYLIYYKYGRFPGLQKFVSIPQVNIPIFLKTEMPISPVDLYKKFAGTDAKALVSIYALVALNIHFGRNKYISQVYLKNLTYQALSKENDKIFMSLNYIELLVNDLLEQFVIKENAEIEKCSVISKQIRNKLERDFKDSLSPEMKIQRGEEEEEIIEPKPIEFSTPLKIEEINEIYDRQKEDYLRTALKLNETDLEVAAEVADAEFYFQNSNLDTSFRLSDTLQERIEDMLENARQKVSPLKFPGELTENIPNDPVYPLSQIETEDIYTDDSLRDMLYPGDPIYFPQPSTDNRKDFEVNITGDEMIVFKSPALILATVEKKELKNKKIIED